MNVVFLDTVGLLATWDEADQWHKVAFPVYERILRDRVLVTTTTAVLLECGNAAARTTYREDIVELRLRLERSSLLISVEEDDWQRAWLEYSHGDRASAGIVDHISFAVMRRLGITQAFTNDQHFRAAGFQTLF